MEPLLYHQPQTILNVVGQLLLLSPAQPEVNAVSELVVRQPQADEAVER